MRYSLICLLFILSCTAIKTDENEILAVMQMQEKAWNNGNIDEFMEGYWQSDSLMFIGATGIKYGWKNTLHNYKKSYPDKATMGKLIFKVVKLEINNNSAYMLGEWSLTREADEPKGFFTLYWKKINDNWVITIDHTS